MSRRRSKRPVVPGAEEALKRIKAEAMRKEGFIVDMNDPDLVKYEVARSLHIPLKKGYNGNMTTENAGKVGGKIGGAMVRDMIKQAQAAMVKQ